MPVIIGQEGGRRETSKDLEVSIGPRSYASGPSDSILIQNFIDACKVLAGTDSSTYRRVFIRIVATTTKIDICIIKEEAEEQCCFSGRSRLDTLTTN